MIGRAHRSGFLKLERTAVMRLCVVRFVYARRAAGAGDRRSPRAAVFHVHAGVSDRLRLRRARNRRGAFEIALDGARGGGQ